MKTTDTAVKPPLGLTPKWVRDKERMIEISEAVQRYSAVNKEIPIEWIQEYNHLSIEKVVRTINHTPDSETKNRPLVLHGHTKGNWSFNEIDVFDFKQVSIVSDEKETVNCFWLDDRLERKTNVSHCI